MTTTTDRELVETQLDILLSDHDPSDRFAFLGAQFDLGLAFVWFPQGLGGLEVSRGLQRVVDERLLAAGAPSAIKYNILGIGMGAPVLLAHGTPEQQQRWLRPMYTGEEIWCQLFSEPGAGSDVAALGARAVRDGDEWVVNGQKVWTTIAHVSKWGMIVTRTDPDVPKHRGMTYFIVDMEAEGVEVRPLRQITGEAEFNEVYFNDVRIPDAYRVGEVGDGWRVTLATLMNERVAIGATVQPRNAGTIGDLLEVWRTRGGDESARDEVARLWVEFEAARLTNLRAASNRHRGTPGPEGSTAKLVYAELNKKIYEVATDLMGPEAMLYESYDLVRPEEFASITDLRKAFLRARANSIEGGTSEIMKNILGERVLGLPGEPRVDKDLPWSEVPR
ncbi:MAG TPA: acyl-CoA dehydrogenase family protein [Acidimicrobiia bacterium]|nr:acyl-CoA dehydrogenase family protein [Acidimicrobiia bacterium]